MKQTLLFILLFNLSCSSSKKTGTIVIETKNTTLTHEERKFLIETLFSSLEKFENTIQSLTEEQLHFKTKPKKWSIAECIEHVTLAEIHFSEIVEEEMKKPSNPNLRSKIKIKDEKIRPKMLSRFWKASSPEVFKPSGKFANPYEAIIALQDQRFKTMEYIKTTDDDLRNHFWKHRLTGTIDLYQTILLMSAHLERHIWQIERIKENKNFPS